MEPGSGKKTGDFFGAERQITLDQSLAGARLGQPPGEDLIDL